MDKYSTKYKVFFALNILFTILTLIGAGYVILSLGRKSAGYAVIPMLATFVCKSQLRLEMDKNGSGTENDYST